MSKANHGLIKRRVPRRQPTRKGSKRRFKVKRERWTGDWHQIIREEARGTARHDTTRHSRMTIDTHRQKKKHATMSRLTSRAMLAKTTAKRPARGGA